MVEYYCNKILVDDSKTNCIKPLFLAGIATATFDRYDEISYNSAASEVRIASRKLECVVYCTQDSSCIGIEWFPDTHTCIFLMDSADNSVTQMDGQAYLFQG